MLIFILVTANKLVIVASLNIFQFKILLVISFIFYGPNIIDIIIINIIIIIIVIVIIIIIILTFISVERNARKD